MHSKRKPSGTLIRALALLTALSTALILSLALHAALALAAPPEPRLVID
ncbi:MAG: hypothetical protein GY824_15555, partial [Delftia sp.]|nr:hypothetical protein [Delftia sp.]